MCAFQADVLPVFYENTINPCQKNKLLTVLSAHLKSLERDSRSEKEKDRKHPYYISFSIGIISVIA